MDHEQYPVSHAELVPEPIIQPDGSLNEVVLHEHYGIGLEEAMQPTNFENYAGTIAVMLQSGNCPVGAMLRRQYKERGIDGVISTFNTLATLDSRFNVTITETTMQRESLKKK